MKLVLTIAAGGALGALGRYFLMVRMGQWLGHGFPYATLTVNLVVGVIGSFTTFSTFSLDVVTLMERGNLMGAGAYILASVFLSVAALLGGMMLFRQVLS